MEPNATYDDLCNTIVDAINASGLPLCCIKDILQGLFLEAQQKYACQVQVERQARKAAESATVQQPNTEVQQPPTPLPHTPHKNKEEASVPVAEAQASE